MLLPPLLIAASADDDPASLTKLLIRIGLANPLRVCHSVREATDFLTGCATSRLPVIALVYVSAGNGAGIALGDWMREQPDAIAEIDIVALVPEGDDVSLQWTQATGVAAVTVPVEMRSLIAAMKALALPEKARIDPATLTVQVELWPRAAGVSRQ